MVKRDIVVLGASTGGIEALQAVVRDLPKDFAASIFVVLHIAPSSPNYLHRILERAGSLPASTVTTSQTFEPGHIYVAPADHHLLFDKNGSLQVTRGPKENLARPSIDVLFRSAAAVYGSRVIGVVLTGSLDDGTAGLWAIKERAGIAIVQNPEEAIAPSMPLNALKLVEVDHCAALAKIPALLLQLTQTEVDLKGTKPMSKEMETEVEIAREEDPLSKGVTQFGEPSLFACPECHGVLMQMKEGGNVRFRCHTGHAYSIESLLSDLNQRTEEALWNATRSIQETVLLMRRMANHLEEHNHNQEAEILWNEANQAHQRGERVRQIAMNQDQILPPE
jgi:two-component system chemotaxis response regulator CheB